MGTHTNHSSFKINHPHWEERLKQACRRFRKEGVPFVCITTNDTFSGPKVQPYVSRFTEEDNVLFIVDEAHNFGSEALANIMPSQFKYRIALSATIERHMDKAGTDRLFQFFGDEVINYGLEDAINDKALVPYEYFPIQTAFIMSSSRNPKEFIQRRGRLLRRSEGKIKAVIYDFVTLPRDLDDVLPTDYDEDKSIILGELARINEFGKLAKNRETAEALMTRVMDSYGVYIDIEEETKRAEDYYGDKWT